MLRLLVPSITASAPLVAQAVAGSCRLFANDTAHESRNVSSIGKVSFDASKRNTVFLSGNMANDPYLRTSNTNTQVAEWRLAVRTRNPPPGVALDKDDTMFIKMYAAGDLATDIANNIRKGQRVQVEGKLTLSKVASRKEGSPTHDTDLDIALARSSLVKIKVSRIDLIEQQPGARGRETRETKETKEASSHNL